MVILKATAEKKLMQRDTVKKAIDKIRWNIKNFFFTSEDNREREI